MRDSGSSPLKNAVTVHRQYLSVRAPANAASGRRTILICQQYYIHSIGRLSKPGYVKNNHMRAGQFRVFAGNS
jgi:hypothetical protein